MRVLFVMNTPGFLRYYDETVEQLLEHGHEVVLGFTDERLRAEALDALEERRLRPQLAGRMPRRTDRWGELALALRTLADFARYLDPRFARASWLRDRRRVRLLNYERLARLIGRRDTLPAPLVRALLALLRRCEAAIPSAPEIEAAITAHGTDVVLVSPLVNGASAQTDYVKSAAALGLPCGVCIASWDNLTNKGLVRVLPDRLFVWNDAQRREAVEQHAVPSERIVVTGAQPFDRWFGRRPTASREEFCARVGLDPARPFVLFVGSTSNITDSDVEDAFVARWAAAVRAALDAPGVLVRPHPDRRGEWTTPALQEAGVVWPPERPNSVMPAARGEYFDSLYHAAAIVGINTSAMVEGAILDRPVLTLRLPEFDQSQSGTLHFAHLLPDNGGPLFVSHGLEEHVRQLVALLADPAPAHARNAGFVARFIRPQGAGEPSTPRLVGGIETLAGVRPSAHAGAAERILRPLLLVLAKDMERRAAPPGASRSAAVVHGVLEAGAAAVGKLSPAAAGRLRALDARYARRRRRAAKQRVSERKLAVAQRREAGEELRRSAGVKRR